MAQIFDGRQVAAAARALLETKVRDIAGQGKQCCLAIVLVEGDPASKVYTNALVKLAGEIGVGAIVRSFPETVSIMELLAAVAELNRDESVTGILPMMPLPPHLNADKVAEQLHPDKDIDSINPLNVGLVAAGKSKWAPCTPRAVMAVLDYYGVQLEGRHAVVVGRSNVVGKPLFQLLLARNATVTVCHSRTKNLAELTARGDIVIAAVGKPEFIKPDMIKAGAVVIDVGINELDGRLVGDVEFDAVSRVAGAITPVPGGIGAVSNVMVMEALLRYFD